MAFIESRTTKELAEEALNYIRLYRTDYGVAFSFDSDGYTKKVLFPSLKEAFNAGCKWEKENT